MRKATIPGKIAYVLTFPVEADNRLCRGDDGELVDVNSISLQANLVHQMGNTVVCST